MDQNDDEIFSKVEFPVYSVPRDSEGFVQSFDSEERENILNFYNEFGFVCVRLLEKNEIEASINEIWEACEKFNENFDRNDPSTWDYDFFEANSLGILGSQPCLGPCAFKNRQNLKMYKVFSLLYGTDELWVSLDRWGFMRPTRNVPNGKLEYQKYRTSVEDEIPIGEGQGNILRREILLKNTIFTITKKLKNEFSSTLSEEELALKINDEVARLKVEFENNVIPWKPELKDRKDWSTKASWLHWDLNPWAWLSGLGEDYSFQHFIIENNGSKNLGRGKLQGLINLIDSREEDGGFLCVPGFQKHLSEFVEKTKDTRFAQATLNRHSYSFINLPFASPLNNHAQKITARAGTLIVWSSELLHCNYPNTSSRLRMNQYVKMFPAPEDGQNVENRKKVIAQCLENVEVTDLGKKLFGLVPYREKPVDTTFRNLIIFFGVPLFFSLCYTLQHIY